MFRNVPECSMFRLLSTANKDNNKVMSYIRKSLIIKSASHSVLGIVYIQNYYREAVNIK